MLEMHYTHSEEHALKILERHSVVVFVAAGDDFLKMGQMIHCHQALGVFVKFQRCKAKGSFESNSPIGVLDFHAGSCHDLGQTEIPSSNGAFCGSVMQSHCRKTLSSDATRLLSMLWIYYRTRFASCVGNNLRERQ